MHRHNLTRACVDDICQLFTTLGVKNSPKSFANIQRLLKNNEVDTKAKEYTICNQCNTLSTKATQCQNDSCSQHLSYKQKPIDLLVFPLASQLRTILLNSKTNFTQLNADEDKLADITDGDRYRQIKQDQAGRFFTLTLNVDGVQVSKSSNKSVWIFTFSVNELFRSDRYKIKNLLVGAVASGRGKPSRQQMQIMLQTLVHQLKHLENGMIVRLGSQNEEFVRFFLISACCDKPAQALVQNIAEPIGASGCGRCTIKGKQRLIQYAILTQKTFGRYLFVGETVATRVGSTNKIRVFPMDKLTVALTRNNDLYDSIMNNFYKNGKFIIETNDDRLKGYRGPCVLKELTYFDVGISFLSDSLHNCYHGVAVRLQLLFSLCLFIFFVEKIIFTFP